jgi:hypothetical protein
MDVDEEKSAADKEKEKKDEKKEEEVKKEEPLFEILSNPARVMRPQLQVVSLELPAKYKPMKDLSIGGKFDHKKYQRGNQWIKLMILIDVLKLWFNSNGLFPHPI